MHQPMSHSRSRGKKKSGATPRHRPGPRAKAKWIVPLLHKVYEPGHHPDQLFQRAVSHGVMSHDWQFGNMPPVPGLSQKDVAKIIAFVRELQRANGI